MKNLKLIFAISTAVMLFASCQKDQMPGPQGPQGSAGTNGTNGTNGNANVHAEHFTLIWQSNEYYWYGSFTSSTLPTYLSEAGADGAVLLYLSVDNSVSWIALPYTDMSKTNTFYYWSFQTDQTSAYIHFYTDNGPGTTNPDTYYGTTCQFKIIVIPPAARMAGLKANPNLNWNNYGEVKAALNLKD